MVFELTKKDTTMLKGAGILIIVLHNFFHWVEPSFGENQFSFSGETLSNFLYVFAAQPDHFIQSMFAFFGHYGVPIFVFLSGYGLAKSYGDWKIKYKDFIVKRLWRLYPAFTLAIAVLLLYRYLILDHDFTIRTVGSVFVRYTLIANWIPGKIFTLSGPYWFFSMIVQLYLLFPLLLRIRKKFKFGLGIIAIVSYVLVLLTNDYFSTLGLSLFYNFLGHLPVFVVGMILAFRKTWNFNIWYWLMFTALFIAGQFNAQLWAFSHLAFVFVFIPFVKLTYEYFKNSSYTKFLRFTGRISMAIYLVNGFLRIPWTDLANVATERTSIYLYALIYLVLVYFVAIFLHMAEKLLVNREIGLVGNN